MDPANSQVLIPVEKVTFRIKLKSNKHSRGIKATSTYCLVSLSLFAKCCQCELICFGLPAANSSFLPVVLNQIGWLSVQIKLYLREVSYPYPQTNVSIL